MLQSALTSFDMMMLLPGFSMALHETKTISATSSRRKYGNSQ